MMPYRRRRSASGGLTAAIVLIGLFLSFVFGFNIITFFVFLAIAIFVGSLGTLNPRRIYGGLIGAMWMIILALFFATHFWPLFLLGAILSALMGSLARPIIAALLGLGLFNMFNNQQQQPPYYQPPQQSYTPPGSQQPYYQPPQQPYQPYEQGYQAPTPPAGSYQEGGQQYPYPPQSAQDYEQPQAQYPQQMPPQQ
jgi:energy-coupling factor transporter transmembrane protein EcfT